MTQLKVSLAALLAGMIFSAGCAASDDADCKDGKCDEDATEFDYIVVGSGAGGGPLASRLARAGHSVLLLEAGEDAGDKLEYQIPVMHASSTEEQGLAWHYYVKHYNDDATARRDSKFSCRNPDSGEIRVCEPTGGAECKCPASHPEELGILYPRGGALGGSTAVNAMITVLPKNSDWDGIATLTSDNSWRAANMTQYFRRVQEWLGISRADPKLGVTDLKILMILVCAVFEFVESGWTEGPSLDLLNVVGNSVQMIQLLLKDVNEHILTGKDPVGAWTFPLAVRNAKRNGTREFILDTIEKGFPLTLRTKALVTNVVFADKPAADGKPLVVGVEYLHGARLYRADLARDDSVAPVRKTATARREVILSAGAFNTPQLLKLSGIGPREELEALDIPVVNELAGVGENLQDRYEVGVVAELEDDFKILSSCTFTADQNDPCFRDWQNGKGPYATNGAITSMLMRSSPERAEADIHVFGVPGTFKGYYPGYSRDALARRNTFTWVILKGHTANRAGQVKLRSTDPTDWPEINFRYFDEGDTGQGESDEDVRAVVDAIEFIRKVASRTDTMLLFNRFDETWPGPERDSREELAQWVKDEAWGHHASCSAPIGKDGDRMAVLDSRFRVRGVNGLRVVDASVFPRIPGTFIALPTYMISEKAADVILDDAKKTN